MSSDRPDTTDLFIVNKFLKEMNESTSSNDKVTLIRHSAPVVRKLLYYTYNTFLQFNVTPKVLEKKSELCNKYTKFTRFFEILDSLNQRAITGNKAIEEVNGFIYNNPEYKDIVYLVLERNLKVRASVKIINKAIPKLIPEFNVALANKYSEKTRKKIDLEKDVWFISRKLDGVRCLIFVNEKGKAKSFSRQGKKFSTLSLVEKEIENIGLKNVVFDGEICIVDDKGNEDFQLIMKEIGRKDHTISNPKFQMFDLIPSDIFYRGESESGKLSQRLSLLNRIISKKNLNYVSSLKQIPVTSFEELEKLSQKAFEKGWEGLMIRKDDFYKGKRTDDILKIKEFHDNEYVVKDVMFGPLRYVKEGKEIEEEMLSGVLIEHKGFDVRVGSGFTIDQRKEIFKDPSLILNKTITVQYFEETQNQEGGYSLRFPVIKVIHGKKRST